MTQHLANQNLAIANFIRRLIICEGDGQYPAACRGSVLHARDHLLPDVAPLLEVHPTELVKIRFMRKQLATADLGGIGDAQSITRFIITKARQRFALR